MKVWSWKILPELGFNLQKLKESLKVKKIAKVYRANFHKISLMVWKW